MRKAETLTHSKEFGFISGQSEAEEIFLKGDDQIRFILICSLKKPCDCYRENEF